MQLKSADYIYVLLSGIAGIWQAWCANYGKDSILIAVAMSLPFALVSYLYASLLNTSGDVRGRVDWKRALVLWAGMPVSLVVGSLTILVETKIMYAAGFGMDNFPFDSLRLAIGEGAACLVWVECLAIWSHQGGFRPSRTRLIALFASLFAGVLFAHSLADLILRTFHKDIAVLLTSTVATTISALILVFLRSEAQEFI